MLSLFKKYNNLNKVLLSKDNLYSNIKYIKSLNPNRNIIGVVKANAYGHGLNEIAYLLDKNKNINILAVDNLHEAYELKKIVKKEILILGYTHQDNLKYKRLPFSFVVSDIETLKTLNKYQKNAKIHIEIDTGLNRLGIKFEDIPEFIKVLKSCSNLKVEGIMSHFASADNEKNDDFSKIQISIFKKAIEYFSLEGFNFKYIHISASGGTLDFKENEFNTIRPGLTLYGLGNNPSLKPVLKFISHIIQIKGVKKGEYIGYGLTYKANKDITIGIIPVGYYEGLNRNLSNKGYIKIGNNFYKIVGRISMDLAAIDISDDIKVGTEVIIYSNEPLDRNSIYNTAEILDDEIPYSLLTAINPIMKREII